MVMAGAMVVALALHWEVERGLVLVGWMARG